jgi:hypothetical protein
MSIGRIRPIGPIRRIFKGAQSAPYSYRSASMGSSDAAREAG